MASLAANSSHSPDKGAAKRERARAPYYGRAAIIRDAVLDGDASANENASHSEVTVVEDSDIRPIKRTGRGGGSGIGRAPGTKNRRTTEFRETITMLLDANRLNIPRWVEIIAQGRAAIYNPDGTVLHPAVAPDPDKALQRLGHLAEFAAPKLTRAEVTGDGGGPLTVTIQRLL